MDFLELAENRFSLREFEDKKVEKEKIDKILKAGQLAPTARNNQPQKIFVIESKEALEKIKKCTDSHYNAPLVLLVCYDENVCAKREYDGKITGDIDASIVMTHMMLEAYDLGVGSVWVRHYNPDIVKEEFALPDNLVTVSLLVMGYPKKGAKPSPMHFNKKSIEEMVKYL